MQIGRHREESAATAARTHARTHTHTERRGEERRGDATDTPQGAVRWREGEDERRKEGGMERGATPVSSSSGTQEQQKK